MRMQRSIAGFFKIAAGILDWKLYLIKINIMGYLPGIAQHAPGTVKCMIRLVLLLVFRPKVTILPALEKSLVFGLRACSVPIYRNRMLDFAMNLTGNVTELLQIVECTCVIEIQLYSMELTSIEFMYQPRN